MVVTTTRLCEEFPNMVAEAIVYYLKQYNIKSEVFVTRDGEVSVAIPEQLERILKG